VQAGVNNKGNCYIWQLNGSDVCPLKMVKASYLTCGLERVHVRRVCAAVR